MHFTWMGNLATIQPTTRAVTGLTAIQLTRPANGPGRPKIQLNFEQIELLRSAGYNWNEVADAFMVSRSTVWRRLREYGTVSMGRYSDISDSDLDGIVRDITHRHRHTGQTLMQGHLSSIGIHVQRYRIRDSLHRVDPLGSILRRRQPITRRRYSVPGPNSLWHIDGHHSLIRWGFVTHGGIDGFSRLIVFLYCSTNNKSVTVLELFHRATQLFGIPSRVRSDRGGENFGVCEFMIRSRGLDRGSHIAGSSTHNQRIERLWRDVFRCVCSTFYALFHYLEESHLLDPEDTCDRFVLQSIFGPRINRCLTEFASAWNHHPLRTERNWSPKKIWMNGVLDPTNRDRTAIRDIMDPIPNDGVENFGIDFEGPLPTDMDDNDTVVVDDVECPLDTQDLEEFQELFNPLVACDDYGITLYSTARQFAHNRI